MKVWSEKPVIMAKKLMHKQKGSEYGLTHCRPTHDIARKCHKTLTVTRNVEANLSKATSSLFPIQMIANVERALRTTPQTMRAIINNESITESPP